MSALWMKDGELKAVFDYQYSISRSCSAFRTSLLRRTDSIDDTHLLEILRTKDTQIVELEAKARDHQKVIDLQENEIAKVKEEVTTYQQLLEVNSEWEYVHGSNIRRAPGCENAAGKLRQKW